MGGKFFVIGGKTLVVGSKVLVLGRKAPPVTTITLDASGIIFLKKRENPANICQQNLKIRWHNREMANIRRSTENYVFYVHYFIIKISN